MIQIYNADNANFSNNGDMVLFPESCVINGELNGSWSLELNHPIDDEERYKYIKVGAVISAPSFMPEDQLFRIYSTQKTNSNVTAYARPVFMDSQEEVFLIDKRPTNIGGQAALNLLTEGTPFSGSSNITTANTAYYVRKNLIEAIAGNEDNSFLKRWGGEILYNNYQIIINDSVGADNGIQALFGRNITGINEKVNMDGVITRIIPVAYNGYMLDGAAPWVDSPLINNYPHIYTREVKFDDIKLKSDSQDGTGCNDLAELRNALRRAAEAEFEKGCDLPTCSYDIDMVDLSRTEQYKDYVQFERIGLGDTIECIYSPLDIHTKARVKKIQYDCINKRNESVELGDYAYNYFADITNKTASINSVINTESGTVMAEKISGILNAMNTQLKMQNTAAEKQDVRAILFEDTDINSELYGAMSIGTQGFQIANKRKADDSDWDWATAFTANGGIADVLITGLLTDKMGKNSWNLDTGEFTITNGKINVETDSAELDYIKLKYDDKTTTISSSQVVIEDERVLLRMMAGLGLFITRNKETGESTVIAPGLAQFRIDSQSTYVDYNGISTSGDASVSGVVSTKKCFQAITSDYEKHNGITDTFITGNGKTVTVTGGIITGIS